MIFRTLLFFVVIYFLIKIISRLFLPNQKKKGGRGRGPSIFYRTFNQGPQNQNGRKKNGNNSRQFEEIEEAEYEEITDDDETSSKSSE